MFNIFSMKKIFLILALMFVVSSCSNLSELNERIKGDGVPYVPGF